VCVCVCAYVHVCVVYGVWCVHGHRAAWQVAYLGSLHFHNKQIRCNEATEDEEEVLWFPAWLENSFWVWGPSGFWAKLMCVALEDNASHIKHFIYPPHLFSCPSFTVQQAGQLFILFSLFVFFGCGLWRLPKRTKGNSRFG